MKWFRIESETLKSRTFWTTLVGVIFNFAAPQLGVSVEIIQIVNTILGGGVITFMRSAIAKSALRKGD